MRLEIRDVSKSYGREQALNHVSLDLTEGIYGLLGPNGAGKSTLMNILVQNLEASSGEVLFNGKNIRALGKEYRKRIGYLPQTQIYYPDFTGLEFLYYMASLKGMDKKKAETGIREYLIELGLWDDRNKKLKHYSGGMRQRLLLIQAVMDDPEILILDEPTAGMDPWQRIAVRNLIGKIGLDKIVIISTHVVQDVEQIAGRILFLSKGKILRDGTPEELEAGFEGKIRFFLVKKENISKLEPFGIITGIVRKNGLAEVRIILQRPFPYRGTPSAATIEDLYLWDFGKEPL